MWLNKENITDQQVISLTEKYGTPLYLYDGDYLYRQYINWRENLAENVDIFLSLKANNNLSIANLFCSWGAGIEVASLGELNLALTAGFKPYNIIFSGPGKTREELKFAIKNKIYSIIVESEQEFHLISEIAKEEELKVPVSIRINPDNRLCNTTIKMGGIPSQFGIDEQQIYKIIPQLKENANLHLMGIHIYNGTQNLDEESLMNSFSYTIKLAVELQQKFNVSLTFINLGGGFGIPYFTNEKPLDMQSLTNRINNLIRKFKYIFPDTRFVLESGRYLLAGSGLYVSRVLYTKTSKNANFIIVDGGMHQNVVSTFRGKIVRNNFPIRVVTREEVTTSQKSKVSIVGPLCTPEDCLARNIELPNVNVGDLICILNTGAYGLSFSPTLFLGHNTPAEAIVITGKEYLIRERGNIENLLLNQFSNPNILV
ncbi:diaminopimelate decarboxylase [Priestia megaterium]|uniref:diaminopimelate decarboxylase n=1 Tax=Priestia megaterium TaxID=1404 RepID=UPI002E20588A|nr:diaminopimelate decarboxylase [Priestia megaterium]MED4256814.1 diaminopimelate decarboxylase [Priestia megaterium]